MKDSARYLEPIRIPTGVVRQAHHEREFPFALSPSKGGSSTGLKFSDRLLKVIEWSHEEPTYVGSAPGLIFGGCHGDDEKQVFDELCRIVDEAIELYRADGKPLPPSTSGRDLVNRMQHVA